jgi:hypothetical protein
MGGKAMAVPAERDRREPAKGSAASARIRAGAIKASEFPDLARHDGVMGVPKTEVEGGARAAVRHE